jgi:hypothetical protein
MIRTRSNSVNQNLQSQAFLIGAIAGSFPVKKYNLLYILFMMFSFCLLLTNVGAQPGSKLGPYFYFPSYRYFLNQEQDDWACISDKNICSVFSYLKYDSILVSYPKKHRIPCKYVSQSPMILGARLNPDSYIEWDRIKNFSKSYMRFLISDSSEATLVGMGITPENKDEYQYRVVENDSNELIPWSPIPKMEQNYGATKPYAAFGTFKNPGKQLLIEVANRKNYSMRDGIIFDWQVYTKPEIKEAYVCGRNCFFNLIDSQEKYIFATQFDKETGLPLDLKIPKDSSFSLEIKLKRFANTTYDVYFEKNTKEGQKYMPLMTNVKDNNIRIDGRYFDVPGVYELVIYRTGHFNEKASIRFEVLKPSKKKFTAKQFLTFGLGLFVFFTLLFLLYYQRVKQNNKKLVQQKERTSLQLKAIRSQLNPHFTFNALNSIQNLMNKNDVDAANHYLARFASLTRRVLTSGDKDLISLADEITLLDDYLQMEQLRFGFTYKINVDEALNKANLEIPFMLLQPFVENAVKHGVSTLTDKGLIEINIVREAKNLLLSVSDNGSGFNEENLKPDSKGMGLKLCRERIKLLNHRYEKQAISLNIVTNNKGSKITVILADWLA